MLGLVGESGPGMSSTAPAVLGLLPGNADVRGSVRLDRAGALRRRGTEVATCPRQDVTREQALEGAVEQLDLVGVPELALRSRAFPYETADQGLFPRVREVV